MGLITKVVEKFGLYNSDHTPFNSYPTVWFCGAFQPVCEFFISLFTDADVSVDNFTKERVAWMLSNMPAGGSELSTFHYGQLINTDKPRFKRYDMGSPQQNMWKYNQTSPPDYDLSLLDFPVAVFSGDTDRLADPKDVAWTVEQIKHTMVFNKEYHMGHLTFAVAKNMTYWNDDLMPLIKEYNK